MIFDLRKDAAQTDINAAVDEMGLGRINSLVARWTFKHMLLKRAYLQEDFRRMASQTPFSACDRNDLHVEARICR